MSDHRNIRVFVSSTFRDMEAERDHLVKFIFPQLRRLCETRGVVWGEVDLRWGVTDEAAAEGKVLPICLEEITRCRPYFIGLLGERYGWVPQEVAAELIDREPWLGKEVQEGKSVTELEIIHGVLRNEEMRQRACFYFRDPKYVEDIPVDLKLNFTAESAEHAQKLSRVKEAIRRSRDEHVCHLRESYGSLEELGQWILEDFTGIINELFPEGSQPDPLDREAADHEAFAQSRARVYIGRPEYFERLDAHAVGQNTPLVVLGESGSGKSALLANWALRRRATCPGDLLILHFVGGTPHSSDWAAMLRRIMAEFQRRFGITQEIPSQPDALRAAFANWLSMAAARDRIVLVLDALNQLEDREGALDLVWLPPVIPDNVRLILSTLPGRPLDELRKRRWLELKVEPLDQIEREKLVVNYLAQYTKALSPARAARIVAAPQSTNPLYLRALLEELRLFGQHERLDERISYYLKAETIPQLYAKILARWEADYEGDTDLVGDAMTLLWAARRGLTESELLLALGKDGMPLPRAIWSPLFLAARDSLVSRNGQLTFSHEYFREAVQDAYIPQEAGQRAAHLRLAEFFAAQPVSPRQFDELPWQLMEAAAWLRLYSLVSDLPFCEAFSNASEYDMKTCWARLEERGFRVAEAFRSVLSEPWKFDPVDLRLASFLMFGFGYHAESLAMDSYLADYFRRTGNQMKLQQTLGNQALSVDACGDLDGALALYQQAEKICRALGSNEGLQRNLRLQASLHRRRGDLDRAMVLHRQVEQLCRELRDRDGLQSCLGGQALILRVRGDLDGAMALHKQEEQICREMGSKEDLQRSLGHQAMIVRDRGDLDGALALHKQEEQICRDMGSKGDLQRSLGNQAVLFMTRDDLNVAMELLRQQEKLCRELGNREDLQKALGNQAVILLKRGDLDGAMLLFQQQEYMCQELALKDGLQRSFGNQASILRLRGDLNGAMELHKKQEEICCELGDLKELAISLAGQANIFTDMANFFEAVRLAERAYALASDRGLVVLARQIRPIIDFAQAGLAKRNRSAARPAT